MSLTGRVSRLRSTRTITQWPDGLNNILEQEDWVVILGAEDPDAEILRRCPNYQAVLLALKAAKPDSNGLRRVRV